MLKGYNNYVCAHCGKVVRRYSRKQWVKSYCEITGRTVHLTKLPKDAYIDQEVRLGNNKH